jgi:predicted deacetylase
MHSAPGPRSLIVSLHDVSPHTWEASRWILERLTGLGAKPLTLLLIPNHHHKGHFLEHPAFLEWLREKQSAGHELVLHGYHHLRPQRAEEKPWNRLVTRCYTAWEGEFFDLAPDTARALVSRGLAEMGQAELNSTGFIAPAWLLHPDIESVLAMLGLRYTVRINSVHELQGQRLIRPVRTLCWSTRSRWRRECSLQWNALLSAVQSPEAALRVAVHPPDAMHPTVWTQVEELITRNLRHRQPVTYTQWLNSV